jgi:anti-sigma regulatory factor (Ser/Thr protein kinase)
VREIHSVALAEEAQIGAARRAVHYYAHAQNFTERGLAEIDLVVQEIGTNAFRYAEKVASAAGGPVLHYTTPLAGGRRGLELFYWDKGPGIYNLDRVVRDGVSTGGSLGGGFGAIGRQMDQFEIYSTVRTTGRLALSSIHQRYSTHGTAVLCRKWAEGWAADQQAPPASAAIGAWSRPRVGETYNGDAYFIGERGAQTLYAVTDGLGHGLGAKQAAEAANATLNEWAAGESLEEIFLSVHQALRATRGAVMGAIVVDRGARQISYAGVGNIDVRLVTGDANPPARLLSTNGTLGLRFDKVRVWMAEWPAAPSFAVLTTDGVSLNWDDKSYPGLLERDPQILAGILLRDYGRDNDDATALVVRLD